MGWYGVVSWRDGGWFELSKRVNTMPVVTTQLPCTEWDTRIRFTVECINVLDDPSLRFHAAQERRQGCEEGFPERKRVAVHNVSILPPLQILALEVAVHESKVRLPAVRITAPASAIDVSFVAAQNFAADLAVIVVVAPFRTRKSTVRAFALAGKHTSSRPPALPAGCCSSRHCEKAKPALALTTVRAVFAIVGDAGWLDGADTMGEEEVAFSRGVNVAVGGGGGFTSTVTVTATVTATATADAFARTTAGAAARTTAVAAVPAEVQPTKTFAELHGHVVQIFENLNPNRLSERVHKHRRHHGLAAARPEVVKYLPTAVRIQPAVQSADVLQRSPELTKPDLAVAEGRFVDAATGVRLQAKVAAPSAAARTTTATAAAVTALTLRFEP